MNTTACTVIICLGIAAPLFAADKNLLKDEKARASYAIGMTMGHSLQRQGIEVDGDLVARGVKDVLSGTTLLTPEQAQETLIAFQKDFAANQQKKREELAVKNQAVSDAFLATNKNNPGIVTLPDGLQYKVITNGTGAMPGAADIVTVHYRGTLLDGTEFDSSYKRGQPVKFAVNGVIRGWTEALQKMKVGSKWQLFLPPDLAYGEQSPPGIPPNSVLVFEVELLSAESAPSLTSDIIKVPSDAEMKKGAKIEVIKPEDVKKMQQQ
jgi:FKBP-type peptidyl-prolyl cis-trans isomerase